MDSSNVQDRRVHSYLKGNANTFKVDNSFQIILLPSERRSTVKGKNLHPLGAKGSKFFPFRVDPFPEGAWRIGMQT